MYTRSATVKTDLKPIPFSPTYVWMRVSSGESYTSRPQGRTDEPTWILFTCFGARTDVTYGLDVVIRKAPFVALKYHEAVLDAKAQARDDLISIRVVIRVLNKLEQEVSLLVVKVIGQAVQEGESGEGRRG
jgi:hypothetical protein